MRETSIKTRIKEVRNLCFYWGVEYVFDLQEIIKSCDLLLCKKGDKVWQNEGELNLVVIDGSSEYSSSHGTIPIELVGIKEGNMFRLTFDVHLSLKFGIYYVFKQGLQQSETMMVSPRPVISILIELIYGFGHTGWKKFKVNFHEGIN